MSRSAAPHENGEYALDVFPCMPDGSVDGDAEGHAGRVADGRFETECGLALAQFGRLRGSARREAPYRRCRRCFSLD
jgi:hypothetical protein